MHDLLPSVIRRGLLLVAHLLRASLWWVAGGATSRSGSAAVPLLLRFGLGEADVVTKAASE